ncbi:RNA-binding cell elongation regulator Jag/EloR [Proteinivorax hydrogeniformans]|uniref:RNA-binding protein KhpB n=1 Tax=Proteinivorax hydrogeniformans TaxID=1826727 RepID=A0AAU8HTK3_9FIRM
MRSVEVSAKSVKDALEQGLQQLGLEEEQVTYDILEEPTKGILGLLSKPAKIVITEKFNPEKFVKGFLIEFLEHFNVSFVIDLKQDQSSLKVNITGEDLGVLIGKHGKTLDSIQYITNLALNRKTEEYFRVVIDVNNYREKREETLVSLANRLASKAINTKRKVLLEPMNAMERRIIHSTLNDSTTVKTYSVGEEPFRKVAIEPK